MKYISLKDVCKINMGQSPDSSSYNDTEDGIPFFQGNADFGKKYPITRVWCNAPTKIAEPEDILISVRAPIGALNYAKEKCCIGRGLAALTPDKNKVSSEFVYWFLKGKNTELNNKGTGSTFKAISRKVLEETRIPDISLERQCEYAEILEKVYGVIQKRKEEIRCLDDLIRARFVEMFGNPLDGTAKYTIHQVGEVAESVDPQPSHRTPPVVENGIPYVSIKDCDYKTGTIDFEGARKVSITVLEEHLKRYTLHEGDFVIGKIGTIGNPVFVPARNDYTLSANVVLVQPNAELVSPYFLKYSFESDFVERQFAEAKNSTSQAAFGIQKVRAVEVMNPNIEIQREFEQFVKQVDKSKVAVQKALDETQILFDSLMQKYFG